MKAQIFRYSNWILETKASKLKSCFQNLLESSGFTVLSVQEHHFSPQGYTCLWLLGESHLAVHTFPEKQASYIELSSCNEQKQAQFVYDFEKSCAVSDSIEIETSRPNLERSIN